MRRRSRRLQISFQVAVDLVVAALEVFPREAPAVFGAERKGDGELIWQLRVRALDAQLHVDDVGLGRLRGTAAAAARPGACALGPRLRALPVANQAHADYARLGGALDKLAAEVLHEAAQLE